MAKAKRSKKKGSDSRVGLLSPEVIAPMVVTVRHERVLLDSDLAELYGVSTGRLNEAVKRNTDRFPNDFMSQLSNQEWENFQSLRSQIATLNAKGNKRGQHRKYAPYVFTEQGVAMLSSVLRSPRAVEVNIAIMRTFVQLRRLMDSNRELAKKIESLEAKYEEHDNKFQLVFDAIKQLIRTEDEPKRRIGFHED